MRRDDAARERRAWAQALIGRAADPAVTYGSPEWHTLPEGSPAKVAAAVIAAECWAEDADNLPDRLHVELAAERVAYKRTDDAEFQARARAHRDQWQHLARTPARYVGQQARPLEQIGAEYMGDQRARAAG